MILNDQDDGNEEEVRGKFAKWFDYFGVVDNRNVGVMVVSHPQHPSTTWLHARDYGVVATSPFPKQPRERREPFVKTWVKQGEPFRLSYAILNHDLPEDKTLDRESAYQTAVEFLQTP